MVSKAKNWVIANPDFAFALLLAVCVYGYFAVTNEFFATHRTTYAIFERFAVLGLVGLALTLCIIAGEIDLSIGSNAALAAVIAVRFTDSIGAVQASLIAMAVATLIGMIQGYFIAYLRVRAIVLTVGTLMLLRGVALFAAEEKTVMLTDFTVPDFISTKMFLYFSPASLLVIGVFFLVWLFLNFTRFGREIYAIGGARKEALASGISLKRPMVIVFALSGFCAGLGGVIIGMRSGTAQALGLQYLLLAGTVAAFIGGVSIGMRSGTAQALGLQYLLLAGTVAAFIGGVSIMGGRGGVIGAAIGTLSVNFLNTGLVFNVTPAFMVQLYLGVLLMVVIMFQTSSRLFENVQRRNQLIVDVDARRKELLDKKQQHSHALNSS